LLWIFGQPLQPRDTANGQQDDVAGFDPVASGHKCMAELMQHHANEYRHDEGHASEYGNNVLRLAPVNQRHPNKQEEKSKMNKYINSGKSAYFDRPSHLPTPFNATTLTCFFS
jgi:hypothetical protein